MIVVKTQNLGTFLMPWAAEKGGATWQHSRSLGALRIHSFFLKGKVLVEDTRQIKIWYIVYRLLICLSEF